MRDADRSVLRFENDVILSIVHLFPETDKPYECYVIGGSDETIDGLVEDYGEFTFPIGDVMRYDSYSLANLISAMSKACLGLRQFTFGVSELYKDNNNGN